MARIVVQKSRGKDVWWLSAREADGVPVFRGVGVCVYRNPTNLRFYVGSRDGDPVAFEDSGAAIAEAKNVVRRQLMERGL